MIAHGKVTGPYARKYSEYCYRKPIITPVVCTRDLSEHPQGKNIETVDLLDYTIEVTGDEGLMKDESARCVVEVYLEANEYTPANKRKRVLRVIVDSYYSADMNHLDSLVQLVFEPIRADVKNDG